MKRLLKIIDMFQGGMIKSHIKPALQFLGKVFFQI